METKKYMFKLGYKLYSMISNWSQLEIKFMLCYGFMKEKQAMFPQDDHFFSAKTMGDYLGFKKQTAYNFPVKVIPRLTSRTFQFQGKTVPCFDSISYEKRKFNLEYSQEAFNWLFLGDDGDYYVDVDIRSLRQFSNTGLGLSLYLRLLFAKSYSLALSKEQAEALFFTDESYLNNIGVQHQMLKKAVQEINSCTELFVVLFPIKSASRITRWQFAIERLAIREKDTTVWYGKEFPSLVKYVENADMGFISNYLIEIIAFFSKDYAMFCRLVDSLKEWLLLWDIRGTADKKLEKHIVLLLLSFLRGESFSWYTHPKILSLLDYGIFNNKLDICDMIGTIKEANDYHSLRQMMKL